MNDPGWANAQLLSVTRWGLRSRALSRMPVRSGAVINVTVPSGTPGGDTVYLAGNYNVLGTGIGSYHDWLAYDYPMIKTGTDTWTLTITGVPTANFQYKFTLGSWNNVEETSSCGAVANRTFGFDTADATYTANDTVAAWDGVGSC